MTPKHTAGLVRIIHDLLFEAKDMSRARLVMRTDGKRWAVSRYLPAGMDIAPDHWTNWRTEAEADLHFASQTQYLWRMGFTIAKAKGEVQP